MFPDVRHNYPEGYQHPDYDKGRTPHCPLSQIVEIGNALAGRQVNPENFCTERIENAHFSDGFIHYFEGGTFIPVVSCSLANRAIIDQLKFVEKDVTLPPEDEIDGQLANAANLEEKSKILKSYDTIKANFDLRNSIFARWRQVVFETCCSTTDDEENGHFRRFESADQLTEAEIISRVKQFQDALQIVVGYGVGTVGWYADGAQNCNHSPHYHNR